MNLRQAFSLIRQSATSWISDGAPSMAAALSYYTTFSLAPLLLIVISVAGLVFGEEAARGEIFEQLRDLMGDEGASATQLLLESLNKPAQSLIATIVSIGALLVGATTVFAELQSSLDRIWRVPEHERPSGLWNLLRTRVLSFGIILGFGFLLLVSLVLSAVLHALGRWWQPLLGGWQGLATTLNMAVSFGFIAAAFAMIYKFMPSIHIRWRDVFVGAVVTAALFTVGKMLIGLYIGRSGVASGFGAAASLMVLLIWIYYSAMIFLLGAEFTSVYAHTHGSLKNRTLPPPATPASPRVAGEQPRGGG